MFLMMPYMAVSQTVSTFVAQNYGAGQIGRIRRAVKISYLCGAALTAGITLFTVPLAPWMVRMFSGPVFTGGGALSDDFGVVKPYQIRLAEYRQQDTARHFQRDRADREISVRGVSHTAVSVYGGDFLRAGDLGVYGSGTFVGVLEESAGYGV